MCEKVVFVGDSSKENQALRTDKDPWAHRSQGMRCATCMWFVAKASKFNLVGLRGRLGRCRRHAPTMNGYPVVFELDWCGDHKLDETKL